MEVLGSINQIVAAGSVDGVFSSAAVLRQNPQARVVFTQAFQVDKLDLSKWPEGARVIFVDLAVNNREPAMTVAFLKRLAEAGHQLVAIADEHDAAAWQQACQAAGVEWDGLTIKPATRSEAVYSTGALLLSALGEVDRHTRELCVAADNGDRMRWEGLAEIVNSAIKPAIGDNARREYLARHFAEHLNPDEKIVGWCEEYQAMMQAQAEVIAAARDLGKGLVQVETVGHRVDMTALMADLYTSGARIVACKAEMPGRGLVMSFGVGPKVDIDVLAALKQAGLAAEGMTKKATVPFAEADRALAVVTTLL